MDLVVCDWEAGQVKVGMVNDFDEFDVEGGVSVHEDLDIGLILVEWIHTILCEESHQIINLVDWIIDALYSPFGELIEPNKGIVFIGA